MATTSLTSSLGGSTGTKTSTSRHDLTDEQIEQLLARAAHRIEVEAGSSSLAKREKASRFRFPKLVAGTTERPLLVTDNKIAKAGHGSPAVDNHKGEHGIRKVEDPVLAKRIAKEQKSMTAGSKWFDLPKTKLTPELKRDLQLLKMRNVLDPHRHYKKDNGKMNVPEYSQIGTIVEGATEFYSGRVDNKKRKRTFVEEVLAGEQETGRFKRKYGEVQAKKGSGKKAFYKGLQAKRKSGIKKGG